MSEDEVNQLIIRLAKSESDEVRLAAIELFNASRTGATSELLKIFLDDADYLVQIEASRALKNRYDHVAYRLADEILRHPKPKDIGLFRHIAGHLLPLKSSAESGVHVKVRRNAFEAMSTYLSASGQTERLAEYGNDWDPALQSRTYDELEASGNSNLINSNHRRNRVNHCIGRAMSISITINTNMRNEPLMTSMIGFYIAFMSVGPGLQMHEWYTEIDGPEFAKEFIKKTDRETQINLFRDILDVTDWDQIASISRSTLADPEQMENMEKKEWRRVLSAALLRLFSQNHESKGSWNDFRTLIRKEYY